MNLNDHAKKDKANDHAKKDKAKWILTGITLILILALLGGVIAVLVTGTDLQEMLQAAIDNPGEDINDNADQTEGTGTDIQSEDQSDEAVNEEV